MFREVTFTDVGCTAATDDARAGFVMDEESFRAFYDRTARGIWAYLARISGDRQLADDLLQETFYRFLRAAATHHDEGHRRNSLYLIATNVARDARRRNLVRIPLGDTGNEIERAPSAVPAGTPEKVADLNRAMARLNTRERAMLWLAYAEGASHREIANVLGLRPASIKLLMFRARRKLAGLLGGGPR